MASPMEKVERENLPDTRVRPITRNEIDDRLVALYCRVFSDSEYREDFSAEQACKSLEELTTLPGGLLLVASPSSSDQPIGFAGGYEWTKETCGKHRHAYEVLETALALAPVFRIEELGVDPALRQKGVGTALLVRLLAHARTNGYHVFVLNTNPDNVPAIGLYRKNGFSLLYDHDGLITFPYTQPRVSKRSDTDNRPYLYWVDDFSRVTLKNKEKVCLGFFGPKSWQQHGLEPLKLFADQISVLFGKAFYPARHPPRTWDSEHIMKRLPKVKLGALAFGGSPREAIAYALFDQAFWDEQRILFVDSMGVSKVSLDWQGSGLGTQMLREALKRLPAEIVAARTQNPAFVLMLQKLGAPELLPGESGYSGNHAELLNALAEQVVELQGADIDRSTGVCKKAYREGRLGDYKIDRKNKAVRQIEQRFQRLGLVREQGDAVIVVAKGVLPPEA